MITMPAPDDAVVEATKARLKSLVDGLTRSLELLSRPKLSIGAARLYPCQTQMPKSCCCMPTRSCIMSRPPGSGSPGPMRLWPPHSCNSCKYRAVNSETRPAVRAIVGHVTGKSTQPGAGSGPARSPGFTSGSRVSGGAGWSCRGGSLSSRSLTVGLVRLSPRMMRSMSLASSVSYLISALAIASTRSRLASRSLRVSS